MSDNPLDILQRTAPKLMEQVEGHRDLTFADGALPCKVKFLIAMALDADHGAIQGVTSLARAAIAAGATQDEISDALRVAYFIGGVGSVYTAARGLKDVF